jgi:hypothetical protein
MARVIIPCITKMSCPVPPPLLKTYSDKINIYNNSNFIPLPPWRSCPAPSMLFIAPVVLTQSPCGGPPRIDAIPQPTNQVGSYYVYPNAGTPVNGTPVPPYKSCQSCQ